MIQAKQELLSALEAVLAQMAAGVAVPCAFESPKVAAHGDLAITAAMPLARALKTNPRELALALVEAPEAAAGHDALGAGHRDRRAGLHQSAPGPGRQTSRRVGCAARRCRLWLPAAERAACAGGVCLRQPHRSAARGPRAAGRAGRGHLQPVCHPGLAGHAGVLLQRRGRADCHAGAVDAKPPEGPAPRRRRLARQRLQRRLHRRYRRGLSRARHGQGR